MKALVCLCFAGLVYILLAAPPCGGQLIFGNASAQQGPAQATPSPQPPAAPAAAPQQQPAAVPQPQPPPAASDADAAILQQFAKAFGNFNQALAENNLSAWTGDACSWAGITCAAGSQRVTNISLGGLGLQGAFDCTPQLLHCSAVGVTIHFW